MPNSKKKGNRGERELSRELRKLFNLHARRGQQFSGEEGKDVVVEDAHGDRLPLHVECKRVEKLNILEALIQAIYDAEPNECPIVCSRRNGEPWIVSLRLDDLPQLVEILYEYVEEEDEE